MFYQFEEFLFGFIVALNSLRKKFVAVLDYIDIKLFILNLMDEVTHQSIVVARVYKSNWLSNEVFYLG